MSTVETNLLRYIRSCVVVPELRAGFGLLHCSITLCCSMNSWQ
jgi:hypothetical protein